MTQITAGNLCIQHVNSLINFIMLDPLAITGLVKFVPIGDMRDRMVVVMCNLKPAKMRGILSEGMLMCASTHEKVEPIRPPKNAVPGDR